MSFDKDGDTEQASCSGCLIGLTPVFLACMALGSYLGDPMLGIPVFILSTFVLMVVFYDILPKSKR